MYSTTISVYLSSAKRDRVSFQISRIFALSFDRHQSGPLIEKRIARTISQRFIIAHSFPEFLEHDQFFFKAFGVG